MLSEVVVGNLYGINTLSIVDAASITNTVESNFDEFLERLNETIQKTLPVEQSLPIVPATENVTVQKPKSDQDSRVRWTANDDIRMHKEFLALLSTYSLTQNDFKDSLVKTSKTHKVFLKELATISEWRGTLKSCLKRIQRMFNNQKFTYREARKLKRLLKMNQKGLITMDFILEEFPGKTIANIEEFKESL